MIATNMCSNFGGKWSCKSSPQNLPRKLRVINVLHTIHTAIRKFSIHLPSEGSLRSPTSNDVQTSR